MTSHGCHRFVASALLAGLVLAGCESSQVDRSAPIEVSGRILRAEGSPAAGAPVGLERNPGVGDILGSALLVPLTLSTACLADPPPAVCRNRSVRRTTTAADTTFSFHLTGKDTQGFLGTAESLSLSAEVAPAAGEVAGAAVTATFKVQTPALQLHDLQLWQPKVTVAAGRVGWEVRAGAGAYQVLVEDAGGQPVWSFDGARPEVALDPRILEDTAGSLAVSVRDKATAEGTTVGVLRRSARVGYRSAAGPPVSRGRPCAVGAGAPSTAPCSLTDGDLSARISPPSTTTTAPLTTGSTIAPAPETATVDLGQSRAVGLVVVRGCTCQVEGSTDGRTWTTLGRSTGYTAVVPARTAAARYVRVAGALSDLREVSVW